MWERFCTLWRESHPIVSRRPALPRAARRVGGARALVGAMVLTGCSTVSERGVPPTSLRAVVPPSAVAAFAPEEMPSPRIMWIPAWGIYLREGQDVVVRHGIYYRYDAGAWYAARSAHGPWTQLGGTPDTPETEAGLAARPPAEESPARRGEVRAPAGHRGVAADPSTSGHSPIIDKAMKHVGAPYRWGGSTPAGFDCSGFVLYVYGKAGIDLPRTAAAQYQVGTPVRRASLRPGDLVFFDRLRHNGIYIGGGQFVHASSGAGRVSVSRLDGPWFRQRWSGARRVQAAPVGGDEVD